jgi:nucleotide-binding universal stress UspA family protein
MSGPIIVGIGGNGSGFEAAREAARLADALKVALIFVFGYESTPLGPRGGPLEERVAAVGDEAVDQIRIEILDAHPTLTVEVELVGQRPADALISVAEARGASIIAVGHGGKGPLRAALLGNVTYEMVHRSSIPVLVVPDDDDDEVTTE